MSWDLKGRQEWSGSEACQAQEELCQVGKCPQANNTGPGQDAFGKVREMRPASQFRAGLQGSDKPCSAFSAKQS